MQVMRARGFIEEAQMRVDVVNRFESSIPADTDHPYLKGPFAPQVEEVNAEDLQVLEGSIPADLDGIYYRNTQNPLHAAIGVHHPFDGHGMIHQIAFRDGKASYRNRFVRTEALAAEDEAGRALWAGVAGRPEMSTRPGVGNHDWIKDASSTDVVVHAGQLLSTYYICGEARRLDALTLEPLGTDVWSPAEGVSAHARVDPANGELLFFNYSKTAPYMHYGVVDRTNRLVHYTPVPLPGPRLPHDMCFTENYAILNDSPLHWDEDLLKTGRHLARLHDKPMRFAIIPRRGGVEDIQWFEAAPTYVLHWVNAYEVGDEIVLDGFFQDNPVPAFPPEAKTPYDKMSVFLDMNAMGARLHRWRFNLKTGETTEERLRDAVTEFGKFNENFTAKPYRYVYAATGEPGYFLFNALVKHDLETGQDEVLKLGEGVFGSEAPFAPRTGATVEDDGYVVSFLTDEKTGQSECVIIDAQKFSEGPICRLALPHKISSGTHACWAPGEDLRSGMLSAG